MLRLANVRNGLAYPHDDLCHFQSQHGHHRSQGYFRLDAMPLRAVVHLLVGGQIVIVDATSKNRLTDALRFGVPTWCAVFNRALRYGIHRGREGVPCDWWTTAMEEAARSAIARSGCQTIRKLAYLYACADTRPALIGKNVLLECHGGISWDDKPAILADNLYLGQDRLHQSWDQALADSLYPWLKDPAR